MNLLQKIKLQYLYFRLWCEAHAGTDPSWTIRRISDFRNEVEGVEVLPLSIFRLSPSAVTEDTES